MSTPSPERRTSPPRVGASAIAVALVLAVALALWLRPGPGAPPPTTEPANAAATVAPAAPRAEAPAAAPREASALPEGLEVEVRTETGAPFANAHIRVTGDDPTFGLPPTDANGLARSDRLPSDYVTLHVVQDGRSGLESWHPDRPTHVRIDTQLDVAIEVEVRDEHRAPVAGLRVQLLPIPGMVWAASAPEAATGDDGCARFNLPATDPLARQPSLCACASNGSRQVTSAPQAIEKGAPTRVSLTFPSREAEAGLLVRFRERDGSPARVRGVLEWSYVMSPPQHNRFGFESGSVDGSTFRIDDARATDLLQLWLREPGRVVVEFQAEMPADAARQEVLATRGGAMPRLAIPLVDADGAPVTSGEYAAYVQWSESWEEDRMPLVPDAHGVLTVPLRRAGRGAIEIARPHRPAELHWPARANLTRPYNTIIGKLPPLPPALAVLTFGELAADQVLPLPPVVVPVLAPRLTGRVVDAARQPVAGVRIGITTGEREPQDPFADFAVHSGDDGRFAIVATSLPPAFHVFGRRPEGFCAPVLAHPGDDIELTLQATGTVRFATLASEGRRVLFSLAPDADSMRDGWWRLLAGDDDLARLDRFSQRGEVAFGDLAPGSYRLRANVGENLVRDALVIVRAGETTRPPDFDGQSFTHTIERVAVRVRGPDSKPLAAAFVIVRLPEWRATNPNGVGQRTDANGEAWFELPRGALADVDITAEKLATLQLRAASLPIDATMIAGTSLDVAITGHGELAKRVRALIVNCRPHGDIAPDTPIQQIGAERYLYHPQCALDADGRATIPNLAPGKWRVWLTTLHNATPDMPFVCLGDFVTTATAPSLAIPHTLTAEELAVLGGR